VSRGEKQRVGRRGEDAQEGSRYRGSQKKTRSARNSLRGIVAKRIAKAAASIGT